jgi:hypothetical protein
MSLMFVGNSAMFPLDTDKGGTKSSKRRRGALEREDKPFGTRMYLGASMCSKGHLRSIKRPFSLHSCFPGYAGHCPRGGAGSHVSLRGGSIPIGGVRDGMVSPLPLPHPYAALKVRCDVVVYLFSIFFLRRRRGEGGNRRDRPRNDTWHTEPPPEERPVNNYR